MENKHDYCVIMCGGAGTRFWPYSRTSCPKQFLDFLGTGRTLLQSTVDRALNLVRPDHIYLVTNAAYGDLVRRQVPEVPEKNIMLEPARRNTGPCICWSAHHIHALDPEAAIFTLPADHIILKEVAFVDAIRESMAFCRSHNALLTLGIKPSAPNTGYGYIQLGKPVTGSPDMRKVKSFTEKPDLEMARFFVSSGEFFWNAGIFIWKTADILNAFERFDPETAQLFDAGDAIYGTPAEEKFIAETFPKAKAISIDYAIMEKADNVYVKTVDLRWSDLGTWRALIDMSRRGDDGNVCTGGKCLVGGCTNSVFAIPEGKVLVAQGLDGYIVAENDNALLICPISEEQKVRNIVNEVRINFGDEFV